MSLETNHMKMHLHLQALLLARKSNSEHNMLPEWFKNYENKNVGVLSSICTP